MNLEPLPQPGGGNLAYNQRLVEMARALALDPAILLLDEPTAGMNAEEKESMARFILDVHEERGITVVVIDHDIDVIMDISPGGGAGLREEDRGGDAGGGEGGCGGDRCVWGVRGMRVDVGDLQPHNARIARGGSPCAMSNLAAE